MAEADRLLRENYLTIAKESEKVDLDRLKRRYEKYMRGETRIKPDHPDFDNGRKIFEYLIKTREENMPSSVVGFMRSLGQGATLGFADEMEAGVRSVVPEFLGGREYGDIRDEIRLENKAYAREYPKSSMTGEVGGAFVPGLGWFKGAKATLPTMSPLGKVAGVGTTGAIIGGVEGYGFSESDDPFLQQLVEPFGDIQTSAIIGGGGNIATGFAAPMFGRGLYETGKTVSKTPETRAKELVSEAINAQPLSDRPTGALMDRSNELQKLGARVANQEKEAGGMLQQDALIRQQGAHSRADAALTEATGYTADAYRATKRADEARRAEISERMGQINQRTVNPTPDLTTHLADSRRLKVFLKEQIGDYNDQKRIDGDPFVQRFDQEGAELSDAIPDKKGTEGEQLRRWLEVNQPPLEFYESIRQKVADEVSMLIARGSTSAKGRAASLNNSLKYMVDMVDEQYPQYKNIRSHLAQSHAIEEGYALGEKFKPTASQERLNAALDDVEDLAGLKTRLGSFGLDDEQIERIMRERTERFRMAARYNQDVARSMIPDEGNLGRLANTEKKQEILRGGAKNEGAAEELIGVLSDEKRFGEGYNLLTAARGPKTGTITTGADELSIYKDVWNRLTNSLTSETATEVTRLLRKEMSPEEIFELANQKTPDIRFMPKVHTIAAATGVSVPVLMQAISSTVYDDPGLEIMERDRQPTYRKFQDSQASQ